MLAGWTESITAPSKYMLFYAFPGRAFLNKRKIHPKLNEMSFLFLKQGCFKDIVELVIKNSFKHMVGGFGQPHFFKASPYSLYVFSKNMMLKYLARYLDFCIFIMFSRGFFKDTFLVSDG